MSSCFSRAAALLNVFLPAFFLIKFTTAFAAVLVTPDRTLRVEANGSREQTSVRLLLRNGSQWQPVLGASSSPIRIVDENGVSICAIDEAHLEERAGRQALVLSGRCDAGSFVERIQPADAPGVLSVDTVFALANAVPKLLSIEDRYNFLPPRRAPGDPTGPLDFVWSQNIKNEADGVIPTGAFKSPAVMMQQGRAFAALLPHLSTRQAEPLALDLDVTSEATPWMSYGAISSQAYGHSYFRRAPSEKAATVPLKIVAHTIRYSYDILISAEPGRQGYRRVVRRLWQTMGHPELLASPDEQRNIIGPELSSFDSWRFEAWHNYADKVFHQFDCAGRLCGTLASNRNVFGDWQHGAPDAWFNAWFQTLRTAYGWYLYGRSINDSAIQSKAESVLTLALSAPQNRGAFPSIYLLGEKKWIRDDGWAGYSDRYHAFDMSWTAWWMLRWIEDLTPDRRDEVLHYVIPYAEFLLHEQLASGVIPSWYNSNLQPAAEFRHFNAETGASALFLASLGRITGDHRYIAAASRALDFISYEVLPRQRWFDFETFLSCARKDYGFYDAWTAQFPQNNLAEMATAQAYLELYRADHMQTTLATGLRVLDYLLLTQQVWNNPSFSPLLIGGFTTQNTDAEWSDARQGQAASLLFDYYRQTGRFEYLERAVAAARSTFSVAPWENWAHNGDRDAPGAITGFHWGTGSAMTSVEIMQPVLGDGLIDLVQQRGVGFDECSLQDVVVRGNLIAFHLNGAEPTRHYKLRFTGVKPELTYRISWNGGPERLVPGRVLKSEGLFVDQRPTP